jgi:hypothetical protein
MEETFSNRSVPRCYKQDQLEDATNTRVEEGSNTSPLALRAVGSDEKGIPCLGV